MADAFTPFSLSVDTEQEQAMLLQIVDAAQRHLGCNGTMIVAHWMQKIGAAGAVAQAAAGAKKTGRGKH